MTAVILSPGAVHEIRTLQLPTRLFLIEYSHPFMSFCAARSIASYQCCYTPNDP